MSIIDFTIDMYQLFGKKNLLILVCMYIGIYLTIQVDKGADIYMNYLKLSC
jgi:hypothetical protein